MQTLERDLCDIVKEAEETAGLEGTDNRFHITDESSADWLLSKFAAIDAEIGLIKAQAAAAVQRLQSDREGLERLFGGELEAFVRAQVEADKRKRKSIILPHGTCAFRSVPASIKIDEAAALEWAIENGRCVEEVKVLDKAIFRVIALDTLNMTGEVLPGVEIVPERESFSIKFGGKE